MRKISLAGFGLLQDIIAELDEVDSIRCFFAVLFLARDEKVDIEQIEDDIKITSDKRQIDKLIKNGEKISLSHILEE